MISFFDYIENDIERINMTRRCYIKKTYYPNPKHVYYDDNAGVTVVLWNDGDKTIVRAAEGDKHDAYLGYCVALAKKIHGTNSALKRDLEEVLVMTTKKEKKK